MRLFLFTVAAAASLLLSSCGLPGALARTAGSAVRTAGSLAGM